jgi:peptide deformylase
MVQHELSHLDGNLFTDNVPPIRKKMISGKLQRIAKGKVHPRYNSKLK